MTSAKTQPGKGFEKPKEEVPTRRLLLDRKQFHQREDLVLS